MHDFVSHEKAPQGTSQNIFSVGGTNVTVFAKNSAWDSDLYEYLIQPTFGTDMYIETWMNGEDKDKVQLYKPILNQSRCHLIAHLSIDMRA